MSHMLGLPSTRPRHYQKKSLTKQDLQERWKHLELKPATLLHLQELLDTSGVVTAALVTDVIAEEKAFKVAGVGMEWGMEELRLISLEGMRPHLIEVVRVGLETCMTWHLVNVPTSVREQIVELLLALLFLMVSVVAVCFVCRSRKRKSAEWNASA